MKKTVIITGKDNPLIKQVTKLQANTRYRSECGLFVLEGLRLCDDAMQNGIRFEKVLFTQGFREKNPQFVKQAVDNSDESFEVSEQLFTKMCDTKTPQGILALCKIKQFKDFVFDKSGRYIALENLSDPANLGAICRSAEALGVSGIIVSADSCDPFSPKVLRASMGTVLRIPIYITADFVATLKSSGLKTYACVVDGSAKSISSVNFGSGSIALIGNEGNGLSKDAVSAADENITIPMHGRVESLNAAVAAALVMWEMMK